MLLYKKNSKIVIMLITITIILSFCIIKYCQHHKNFEDQLIAKNFQIILSAMLSGDVITVKNQSNDLIKFGNRTPYPRLAALFLAKLAFSNNDLDEAAKFLNLVVQRKVIDPIWHIANLKLIKVLLLQNKLTEVENIKNSIEHKLPMSFASSYQELFGDLLLAKNDKQNANVLYLKAINNFPKQLPTTLLELKINSTNVESN